MPSITIRDDHPHAVTGRVHSWRARYVVEGEGALVSVAVEVPERPEPFIRQTYLAFDPVNTNAASVVSAYAKKVIDETDFSAAR